MLPSYVTSSLIGRARLRHPLLQTEEGQNTVIAVLKKEKKIYDIQLGASSLLLFFEPELSIEAICRMLEEEIPEFASQAKKDCEPIDSLEKLFGISMRRIENRGMLVLFGLTLFFSALGSERTHTALGCVMTLLLGKHIWVRRKAL